MLRKELLETYKDTAYEIAIPVIQKADQGTLVEFKNLTKVLNLEKVKKLRYADQSKLHLVESLIKTFEEKEVFKSKQKELRRNRYLRLFFRNKINSR